MTLPRVIILAVNISSTVFIPGTKKGPIGPCVVVLWSNLAGLLARCACLACLSNKGAQHIHPKGAPQGNRQAI